MSCPKTCRHAAGGGDQSPNPSFENNACTHQVKLPQHKLAETLWHHSELVLCSWKTDQALNYIFKEQSVTSSMASPGLTGEYFLEII